MARVLITGVGGQDGRYLARALTARGELVHGLSRRPAPHPMLEGVTLHALDVADAVDLCELVREVRPEECYHLAAQHRSSSSVEGEDAAGVWRTNVLGAESLLAALRLHVPGCRVVMASSCQVFGAPREARQSESTPRDPRNAYARSKVVVEEMAEFHRRHLGMHASTAILFNHESPLRCEPFVSARITRAAAEARRTGHAELTLGSLGAQVDWMHAQDAVEALRRIVRADEPGVFVIGSGQLRTTGELAEVAFDVVGLDWRRYVHEDPSLARPVVGLPYAADASALRRHTGWEPTVTFPAMVREMVEHHLEGCR